MILVQFGVYDFFAGAPGIKEILAHRLRMTNLQERAPRLVGESRSFNIVRYGDQYVAVAQELGTVEVSEIMLGRASRPPATKFILGRTLEELEPKIAAADALRHRDAPPMTNLQERVPRLVGESRSFNIVRYGDQYFAVAQELGTVEVAEIMLGRASRPPATKFILGRSLEELEPMIAAADALRHRDAPPRLVETIGDHNIIEWNGRFFALLRLIGRVEVDNFEPNALPGFFSSGSLQQVRKDVLAWQAAPRWRRAADKLKARYIRHRLRGR